MNILITGSDGFVGRNLTEALKNIRDGKDRTHPKLTIDKIYLYDVNSGDDILDDACKYADFVYNLAGVNRPPSPEDFAKGNVDFVSKLLSLLKKHNNRCPVMMSSSIQASLTGRFAESDYGKSKKAGEDLLLGYAGEVGTKAYVYRFPNIFGKWCRPNYNSAVATFCSNIANDLPITVNDENTELELLYIDDLVSELIALPEGAAHRCEFDGVTPIFCDDGKYCAVPCTYHKTLGDIVRLLYSFHNQPQTLMMPEIADGSFEKKLYSAYLSYLPKDKVKFALKMNVDARGSFTELLKTEKCGQFSVNISNPGITKGEHWHNTKWEFFIVVSGHGLIRQRRIGSDSILDFEVCGDKIEAVHMLPGYTHNIINLSKTEPLITLMWANECFNPDKPDTFGEAVEL